MTDELNENPNQPQGDGGKAYTPPATQADLDKIVGERVARERAKYADHADLKAKAARLAEIEAASKTEAEKAADRIEELEKQLADAQSAALRARIQAKHGISDEDAELFLTATDEETLARQAQRFIEIAPKPGKGNVVPGVGISPTQLPTLQEQIRAAEQAGNKQLMMSLKAQQLADLAAKQR